MYTFHPIVDDENKDGEYRSYYVSPITNPTISPKLYYLETGNINIPASSAINLMDEGGDGELKGFKVATNSALMIFEVILYGDNNTNMYINNQTMQDLAKEAAGLSPGDIQTLPNGQSQDKTGLAEDFWPYLRRYKDDTTADYFGNTDRDFILVFSPSEPIPYRRIQINIKNTSSAIKNVRKVRVAGAIYEQTAPVVPTTRTPEPTGQPLTSLRSPNVRGDRATVPITEKNIATTQAEADAADLDVLAETPEELDLSREEQVTKRTAAQDATTNKPKGKPDVKTDDDTIDDADTEAALAEADFYADDEYDTTDY